MSGKVGSLMKTLKDLVTQERLELILPHRNGEISGEACPNMKTNLELFV